MQPYYKQEGNGAQWQSPQVEWDEHGNYRSGGSGGNGNGKPTKKSSGNKNLKTTVVACFASALIAATAAVGGFAALIGTGVIPTGQSGGSGSSTGIAQMSATYAEEDTSTLQGASAKALQSVVLVQAYGTVSGGFGYFGYGHSGGSEQLMGEGSGVIATSDGYIITNHHVIEDAESLKVSLPSGETYDAKVIGSDAMTDLALLKINADKLTVAEFGESSALRVGDRVLAVGNPGGSEFKSSVSFGFVSALDRQLSTNTSANMSVIQTDAAINPGNSGGALCNAAGQVIGINSSKLVATEFEGMGFAIPIDTALPIIEDLRENGKITNRAALGITGQFIDEMTAQYYGMAPGYFVASVKNEKASQAGLTRGDVVVKIDDVDVTSSADLTSYLLTKKPGDTVTVVVDREGESHSFTFPLQELEG